MDPHFSLEKTRFPEGKGRKKPVLPVKKFLCHTKKNPYATQSENLLRQRKKPQVQTRDSDEMRKMGLEPTRHCCHRHLKPARLPIPPLLRNTDDTTGYLKPCQQKNILRAKGRTREGGLSLLKAFPLSEASKRPWIDRVLLIRPCPGKRPEEARAASSWRPLPSGIRFPHTRIPCPIRSRHG